MGHLKRRQLFIDKAVQGALVKRTVIYFFLSMATIVLTLLVWRVFTGPARMFYTHFDDIWFHNGAVFVIMALFLPLIIVDCIKISNRFCGPAMRLRRALHNLAHGKPAAVLKFRDADYWQTFADDFNILLKRVEQLEKEAAESQSTSGKENPSLVAFQAENQEAAESTEAPVPEGDYIPTQNIVITQDLSSLTTGGSEQSV